MPTAKRWKYGKGREPGLELMGERAIRAGARAPLEFLGEGATAVVFCDAAGVGFKVGRYPENLPLRDEADWLSTAQHVPWVKDHVARLFGYDAAHDVIIRECVQMRGTSRKYGSRYVGDREVWDFMREVERHMLPYGWGAPETKRDSVVATRDRGLVIVDAGSAIRIGHNLVVYIGDILAGRRPRRVSDDNESLAFYLRSDMDLGRIPLDIGTSLLRKLT